MKIIKSDSNEMVLKNSAYSAIGVVIGGVFVALSSTMMTSFNYGALVLQLNCQRTAESRATNTVNCIVKEYRFWGLIPFPEQKIDQIRSAQTTIGTYTHTENRGNRQTRRRVFVNLESASKGTVPLSVSDMGIHIDLDQTDTDLDQFVNDFNSFVAGDQTSNLPNSFMFIYDARRNLLLPFVILFFVPLLIGGIYIIRYSLTYGKEKEEWIILDKSQQSLTWKLPYSTSTIQYQLSQIGGVELHTAKIGNGKQAFQQVYLSVESRGLVLIREDYEDEKESVNVQAKQLAEFLGVPIERRLL